MNTRKATINDIKSIETLQSIYLYDNLTEEQRKQGFVTTPFTTEQIETVIKNHGLFVATINDNVIAYVFAASWDFFSQWPIFPYMTTRFQDLNLKGLEITTQNSFQYGPVCIAMEHRGKNILSQLFENMRVEMLQTYPLAVTFINKNNERSYNAHTHKIKWTVVDEFEFNNRHYWGLAYNMSIPIIT